MKISLNWLRSLANFPQPDSELIERLTLLGLEVDAVDKYETIKGGLEGVVVGEVLQINAHPQADRLRICTVKVDLTSEPLQIVCGASNVAEGQKVPVALLGTTLYPVSGEPLVMKKSKIRGVESFGMICAEDELGLGSNHEGIMVLEKHAVVGTPIKNHVDIYTDTIIEIGLTPNRTDAMSHYGVARDLNAYFGVGIEYPAVDFHGQNNHFENSVNITLESTDKCPCYYGLEIKNIQVTESPQWLKNKLHAIGQRTINNIVDITNYVLFTIGQPLHAFDCNKIAKDQNGNPHIIIRQAKDHEEFIALDEKKHILNQNDLVIADTQKAMCLAGIMGGINSGVTNDTKHIFLESAYFIPDTVRKTSSRLGIHSETAYRFSRGTDPQILQYALQYAAKLIHEVCGQDVVITSVIDRSFQGTHPSFLRPELIYNIDRANKLMGVEISTQKTIEILKRLDFSITVLNDKELQLISPLYRTDVTRFQDVVEEVLRVYGLNNVPIPDYVQIKPQQSIVNTFNNQQEKLLDKLASQGFYEIRTNSLIAQKYAIQTEDYQSVDMLNPLSQENAVLRTSMIPSALEVIAYNLNRKNDQLRLFELGKVYYKINDKYLEKCKLAIFICSDVAPKFWQNKVQSTDFFDIKGALENLLTHTKIIYKTTPIESHSLDFSFGLSYLVNKKEIAQVGKIKPSIIKDFDIKNNVWCALIDWDVFQQALNTNKKINYEDLPKFPAVHRDLSMLVESGITYSEIEKLIYEAAPKLIQDIHLFDVYQPKDANQSSHISYALSITLLDKSQTLTDQTVNKAIEKVIQKLEQTNKITIRK